MDELLSAADLWAWVQAQPDHPSYLRRTIMTRTAGLRGRLPGRPEGHRFAIRWAHEYLSSPLPAPSYPVDVSGGITDWGMLGNDKVGDCTFAAREHNRMAKAAAGHETEAWERTDDLVAEYLAYDHGQDNGAVIADLLLAWYQAGTILAFAPVDQSDRSTCDGLAQAFHGVYAGVSLTDDANDRFNRGEPWTVDRGQRPDPNEGHCIVLTGTDGTTDTWVTWGTLQRSTRAWSDACVDEAWVIVTSEDEAALLDMPALLADIDALHGTEPATPPVPVPPSPPTPAPPAPPTPPEPPMTDFPTGDATTDQTTADHDLTVANDEETVAADEAQTATDETQLSEDRDSLTGVVPAPDPANPPTEDNPGLPTTVETATVPPGFAAIVPADVDEGDDLAGQVANPNVETPDIAHLQDPSRGTGGKDLETAPGETE